MAIKKQITISSKKGPGPLKGAALKAKPVGKVVDKSEEIYYEVGDKANTRKRGQMAVAGGSYDKLTKMKSNLDAIKQSKKAAAKPVVKKKK